MYKNTQKISFDINKYLTIYYSNFNNSELIQDNIAKKVYPNLIIGIIANGIN